MFSPPIIDVIASAREHGITSFSHLICLYHLDPDPSPMTELARAANVTTATATSVVKFLESIGLVRRARRTPDTDRRTVIAELTDQGREAVSAIRHGLPPGDTGIPACPPLTPSTQP